VDQERKKTALRGHTDRIKAGCTRDVRIERIGRVTIYKRGSVYYLYCREFGKTIRRRVDGNLATARIGASKVNAAIGEGSPSLFSFRRTSPESFVIGYLDYCENVAGQAFSTVGRYRAALSHFKDFAVGQGISHIDHVNEVTVSTNEYKTAERLKKDFWLYAVFNCASKPDLHTVQDAVRLGWEPLVKVERRAQDPQRPGAGAEETPDGGEGPVAEDLLRRRPPGGAGEGEGVRREVWEGLRGGLRSVGEGPGGLPDVLPLPAEALEAAEDLERERAGVREVRRRTDVVGRFPGEVAALTLICATLEQDRVKWRGVLMDAELLAAVAEAGKEALSDRIDVSVLDGYPEAA